MKVFIYVLTEPDGNTIRYVGKSNENRIGKRLIEHCRYSSLDLHTHKNMWIKSLLRQGLKPVLKIIEECQDNCYKEREKYWIKYYKSIGCDLTNSTEGGEGVLRIHDRTITEEQKETISNTLKRRYKEHPEMYKNCSDAGKKTRGIKRNFKFQQTSDSVGVSFSWRNRKGIICKWRAYATINKRHVHIGLYDTEEEAVNARNEFLKSNPI